VPVEANGGPAVAVYRRGDSGLLEPSAVHVLSWRGGKVSALHAFLDPGLFPLFGLAGS
jgi:RNA polymerase sigma-70 factor (ECF subfamily)